MTKVKTIRDDLFIGDTTYSRGSVIELPDDRALAEVEAGSVAYVVTPKHELSGVDAARAKLGRPA